MPKYRRKVFFNEKRSDKGYYVDTVNKNTAAIIRSLIFLWKMYRIKTPVVNKQGKNSCVILKTA